jgi:catechol 2,3-dioxygenase-like lactoylglutathione lyase family enzyme
MKIIGHRHTGIIVQDFEMMLEFYLGLGLQLRRRDVERGPFVEKLLGIEGIILETAKLILYNEEIDYKYRFQLEIMNIKNNISKQENTNEYFNIMEKQGILDLAFTVDNIEEVIQYILSKDGTILNQPIKTKVGYPALHLYATDPENNVLHLAQNL